MKSLHTSFALGDIALPNRIVMAPMTRSRVSGNGALGALNASYYAQRASAGLIISEAMVVAPEGRGYLFTPGLHTEEQIDGCKIVVNAVHDAGGIIIAQLWHVGRVAHSSVLPNGSAPLGPTSDPVEDLYVFGLDDAGRPGKVHVTPPRAMTDAEIERVVQQFSAAAANARRAGFDGVEILAANGYLFDQFLNGVVNRREGRYGGSSVTTRCALVLETVEAIRAAVGDSFVLGVRLSPFGNFNKIPDDPATSETFLYLASKLAGRTDYVHFNDEPVSIGHLNQSSVENAGEDAAVRGFKRMIPDEFLNDFRRFYPGTVIACGGLTGETAQSMLDNGAADLFAFGVPFIANPDLPARLRDDLPLADPRTEFFYGGGEEGYSDYPAYAPPVADAVESIDREAPQVLAAARSLIDSFSRHDVQAYFDGFSSDATFMFYYVDKPLLSRSEYRDEWSEWERKDGFRVLECRSENQHVQLLDGGHAIFMHDVETDVQYQGEQSTRLERETIVFKRDRAGWIAVHEHLSLHPKEAAA
ncbi:nuclear transport factor 2 family protein [Rhizobium sp. CCGE 510]|uniref:oxidoreductase n=1 Tax=Rhizobium sp. CCGE 510 TaxID=1132836 RepID=UPI00027B8177|nr:nuclear transport factor 2 family protein [Rhizobium sp. CCGE 510]EJT04254.1 NADH:flavin oxidoreductase/NADH oxidase [Rhizobium sp. CCGE 510]